MSDVSPSQVRAWGPASLSNLGPGFDSLGVCLEGLGDVVEAWTDDGPGVRVEPSGGPWEAPLEVSRNTAARAAASAWRQAGRKDGLVLRVHKGLLPGSGLGSSAASAVAGAWAARMLIGGDAPRADSIPHILEGERAATTSVHGDNVVPALMGGVVLVRPDMPSEFRRISISGDVYLAVVRPDIEVLTAEARAVLPARVPLADAVANASALAFLVDALRAGDLEAAGRAMARDSIVEPVRARLVPGLDAVKNAAREAGSPGAALSGSGPAIFAFAADRTSASRILRAMEEAARTFNPVRGVVTRIDEQGARAAAEDEPRQVL